MHFAAIMSDSSVRTLWVKVNDVADYLAPRIVASMLAGAGIGACHSHIQGKPLGLGTLPFVAVGAFGSTAFFATQKGLEMARGKDDVWNYGVSGFFNGGWIGAGLGGVRRGLISAFLLSSIAVAGKYMADSASESLRTQWAQAKERANNTDPKVAPRQGPTLKEKQIAMQKAQEEYEERLRQFRQQQAQQVQQEDGSDSGNSNR